MTRHLVRVRESLNCEATEVSAVSRHGACGRLEGRLGGRLGDRLVSQFLQILISRCSLGNLDTRVLCTVFYVERSVNCVLEFPLIKMRYLASKRIRDNSRVV